MFLIYLTNSQEQQDTFLKWMVKIIELGICFSEEPNASRIESPFDIFWIYIYFFCGSQPVPRLVNSGTTA